MALKRFRPITPGQRFKTVADFSEITTNKPYKPLLKPKKSSGGRDNQGHLAVWHKGGGHKKKYRVIDFKRDKFGIEGTIKTVEYDPNRNVFIGLTSYKDGEYRYTLLPLGMKVGDKIISGKSGIEVKVGNTMPLSEIPVGTQIHNIELAPTKGGQICRSAGAYATISGIVDNYAIIKLPSTEVRRIHTKCLATIGVLGNQQHNRISIGKAGRSRWMGKRPAVRGVVMNPVDHPLGGGEGKSSGGRHPVSRTGQPTKGYKTRQKNKKSDKYIVSRRKK